MRPLHWCRTPLALAVAAALALPASMAPAQQNNPLQLLQGLGGLLGGGAPGGQQPQRGTLQQNLQNNPGAAIGQGAELLRLLGQSLESIDEPKEIEIGRGLASVLLGSKPLSSNMALQRYVNRLGRWIALQSTRPNLPWGFAVLEDPGFNAFAAPGGYVFVTRGLVDSVKDESELAGILAHEIAHVEGKHHLKALQAQARAGFATSLISSLVGGNAVSDQLFALGKNLYSKGLDQADEFEADRVGVTLATRAGFDPYGLVAVLQRLRTVGNDAGYLLALSTHPPTDVRLAQLEQAMGNRLDRFAGAPAATVMQRLAQGR